MKLLFFDDFRLGVVHDDGVVDVSAAVEAVPHTGPHDLISGVIERFEDLPFVETFEQARHFLNGPGAYEGGMYPWSEPITSPQLDAVRGSPQPAGVGDG